MAEDAMAQIALRRRGQGNTVSLRLIGRVELDANSPYNQDKYRPDLVGYLTFDSAKRRFTRFELLAYGQHGVSEEYRSPGGSTYVPYGVLFTLNGTNVNDNQPPTRLQAYKGIGLRAGG